MRRFSGVAGGVLIAATLAACTSGTDGTALPASDSGSASAPAAGTEALTGARLATLADRATTKAQTVRARIQVGLGGEDITGQGAFRLGANETAADMTMSISGVTMRILMVDGDVYIKGAPGTSATKWMKVNAEIAAQAVGQADADPRKTLELLKTVGEVRKVGTETVNGAPATKYAITIDMRKAAKTLGDDAQVGVLVEQGLKTMTMDLWLNEADLPVRMASSMTVPGLGPITQRVDYYDWGKPVTITAPPPSEVITR